MGEAIGQRISLRYRVEAIYHGRTKLSKAKADTLPEVWSFLARLQGGEVKITGAQKAPAICQIKLPGGSLVYLAIARPKPDDPDHDFDWCVLDIWWPDDTN